MQGTANIRESEKGEGEKNPLHQLFRFWHPDEASARERSVHRCAQGARASSKVNREILSCGTQEESGGTPACRFRAFRQIPG